MARRWHWSTGALCLSSRPPLPTAPPTTIHRTDADTQKQGILKLGAFIRKSSQLVVIFSDVYLTKLWTVYEVACFLPLHPIEQMVAVPTFLPLAFFVFFALSLLHALVPHYTHTVIDESVVKQWARMHGGVFAAVFVEVFRHFARTRANANKRLAEFCVQDCTCFCKMIARWCMATLSIS